MGDVVRKLSRTLPAACAGLTLLACTPSAATRNAWPDSVHEEGRTVFHRALSERIRVHPERDQLTEAEIDKIGHVETLYPRLYGTLMNIYYQKDEPVFSALLRQRTDAARDRFRSMYLELAELAADHFVDNFFLTPTYSAYARRTNPDYEGLDAVDLAVRTTGYYAKLDPPEEWKDLKTASPEFDRQWGLDAANFRRAHRVTKGKGAKVAVMDTGIDETHPVFRDTRWGEHFSFVGRSGKPWATDAPLVDWGWHGTLVTSVVARYAPEAQITMYKTYDGETQNGPVYQLVFQALYAASIYRAVHDGNDIISVSGGGLSLDAPYIRDAIRYVYENNRIVVTGNLYHAWLRSGNNRNFPAQHETVISVTAIEKRDDGTLGYWDVCAPDDATTVAAPNGVFGAFPTYTLDEEDTYIPSISAAIPVVSSLAALAIAEYPRLGTEAPGEYVDTITRLITDNADPEIVGFEGFSPQCGYGLIDAHKTVLAAARLHEQRQGSSQGEGRPRTGRR